MLLYSISTFVGSYKNTLFILVIIINTVTGIYQEIKRKNVRSPIYSYYLVEVIRDDELKEGDVIRSFWMIILS